MLKVSTRQYQSANMMGLFAAGTTIPMVVKIFAARGLEVLAANIPIMSGKLIWSFRHLKNQICPLFQIL